MSINAISAKLKQWKSADGSEGFMYWCQGCKRMHSIKTRGQPAWGWNGDTEKPVFSPSVLVTYSANPNASEEFKEWRSERVCHTFIGCNGAQPGEVIFLSDCTHELAGKVLPFPDLPGDDDEA